jgi:hypothetical protein
MDNDKLLTQVFVQRIESDNEKLANETGAFIRQKLREVSFARKIMNPQYITASECQRTAQNDQLVKLIDVEPDSAAMVLTLRGQPTARYVTGNRFEVSFDKISSEEFQKIEIELLAYEMPITEIIERNSVKDIQGKEDAAFMTLTDAVITTNGKSISRLYSSGIQNALVDLFNLLEDSGNTGVTTPMNPLICNTLLMNRNDWNKLSAIPAVIGGSPLASEVFVNGYKYQTVMGKNVIATSKGNLVPAGTMYAFPSQEYMGKFFILNDTKFYVDKKRDLIKWSAEEMVGMAYGNTLSAAKLTLV